MKKASITETKNRLSALLEAVKRGETVLIMDREKPVARLEPVTTDTDEETEGWLRELERTGLVKRPKTHPSKIRLTGPIPKAKGNASIVEALLAEREEAR
jgi:antitoxin (DNA-binding transcriptional repressor) of toxin-antitoxin stability system